MKLIVLGGGLVGGSIAKDLAGDEDFEVSVADINEKSLSKLASEAKLTRVVADLSSSEVIKKIVSDQDIVIGSLPGFLGFNMLHSVIGAGKNVVDISFMAEDPFTLDELAKKNKVTAVVDIGVAPGMSNMIVGYVDSLLDETEGALILVGGLPATREWPYEYKISWSAADVIEEYLRPARLVEYGNLVEKPALSDVKLVNLPGVGTLEEFNTDGLRTLVHTIKVPFMKEKTLRYPGHVEKMLMLKETGFFSDKPIEVGGVKIKPIDFTTKLLFPKWELKEGEKDLTVMRVVVQGKKEQKRLRYTYDLLTYFDEQTNTLSMARVTGSPCAIMARLIARGEYSREGISPAEYIGQDHTIYRKLMKELEKKDIFYKENVEEI